jgi:hypothetical protein
MDSRTKLNKISNESNSDSDCDSYISSKLLNKNELMYLIQKNNELHEDITNLSITNNTNKLNYNLILEKLNHTLINNDQNLQLNKYRITKLNDNILVLKFIGNLKSIFIIFLFIYIWQLNYIEEQK